MAVCRALQVFLFTISILVRHFAVFDPASGFTGELSSDLNILFIVCDDLNDFQYLFKLINKEHIFVRHFEKSDA